MTDKKPVDFFLPKEQKAKRKDEIPRPDPDWMHSLPGYQDEVAIHEELAKKYAKEDKDEDEGEV